MHSRRSLSKSILEVSKPGTVEACPDLSFVKSNEFDSNISRPVSKWRSFTLTQPLLTLDFLKESYSGSLPLSPPVTE